MVCLLFNNGVVWLLTCQNHVKTSTALLVEFVNKQFCCFITLLCGLLIEL